MSLFSCVPASSRLLLGTACAWLIAASPSSAQINLPEKSWVKMTVPASPVYYNDSRDPLEMWGNYPGRSAGDVRFAYNPITQTIILFGGDTQSSYRRDTWSLSAAARRWTLLQYDNDPRSPYGRCQPGIAFAAHLGTMIVGGGVSSRGESIQAGHTGGAIVRWNHAQGTWETAAAQGPADITTSGDFKRNLSYDPKNKKALMYSANNYTGHIYAYDFETGAWETRNHTVQPFSNFSDSKDGSYNLAYDYHRKFFLFIGGGTWKYVYETNTWTQLSSSTPASNGQNTRLDYDPHNRVFVAYTGGSSLHVYDPDLNTWSAFGGGAAPGNRNQAAMAFDVHNNCAVVWGGGGDGDYVYYFRYKSAEVSAFENVYYGEIGHAPLPEYNSGSFIGQGNTRYCWFEDLAGIEMERNPSGAGKARRMRFTFNRPVYPFLPDGRNFDLHFKFGSGRQWVGKKWFSIVAPWDPSVFLLDYDAFTADPGNFFLWSADSTQFVLSASGFGESGGPNVEIGDSVYIGEQCAKQEIQGVDQISLPPGSSLNFSRSIPLSAAPGFRVFPNPLKAGRQLTIHAGEPAIRAGVSAVAEIYNPGGRLVEKVTLLPKQSPFRWAPTRLKTGIYLLRVKTFGKTFSKIFMVEG